MREFCVDCRTMCEVMDIHQPDSGEQDRRRHPDEPSGPVLALDCGHYLQGH